MSLYQFGLFNVVGSAVHGCAVCPSDHLTTTTPSVSPRITLPTPERDPTKCKICGDGSGVSHAYCRARAKHPYPPTPRNQNSAPRSKPAQRHERVPQATAPHRSAPTCQHSGNCTESYLDCRHFHQCDVEPRDCRCPRMRQERRSTASSQSETSSNFTAPTLGGETEVPDTLSSRTSEEWEEWPETRTDSSPPRHPAWDSYQCRDYIEEPKAWIRPEPKPIRKREALRMLFSSQHRNRNC